MPRPIRKYPYSMKGGYKRPGDQNFNNMGFTVVIQTKDVDAAIEKAKAVMLNWPGRNVVEVEVYSAILQDSEEVY